MDKITIRLTQEQLEAVLRVVGPVVSAMAEIHETDPLYQAERELDGALLAREMEGLR